MARTKQATELDLPELEAAHENFNRRRGQFAERRKKLEERKATGEAVHRELRQLEREIDELEAEHADLLPALQDARRAQSKVVQRASQIDRLEQDIATYEDVIAFQEALVDAAEKYLRPHFTRAMSPTGPVPSAYARLGRELLHGNFHENGHYNTPAQLRNHLARARADLARLRDGRS